MEIKDNKLTDYIKVFDNFIPEETNKQFHRILKDYDHRFEDATVSKNSIINKKIRNTLVWFPRQLNCTMTECHWSTFMADACKRGFIEYLRNYQFENLSVKPIDMQFLKYEDSGHYKYHVDAGDINRTISLIYFVNDDYDGGILQFRNPSNPIDITIEKVANRAIVWPSNFLYPHKVTPVSNGVRYSVVAWAL